MIRLIVENVAKMMKLKYKILKDTMEQVFKLKKLPLKARISVKEKLV